MQLSDRGGDARDALMPPRHVGILGQGLVEIDALADERVIVWFQFRDLEDFLRSLGKVNDLVVVVGFRRLATVICFMDLRWLFLLWVGCSAVVEEFAHQAQGQATQGRDLSTLASLRVLRARTPEPAGARRGVGDAVGSGLGT